MHSFIARNHSGLVEDLSERQDDTSVKAENYGGVRETRQAHCHPKWLCLLKDIAKVTQNNSLLERFSKYMETCSKLRGSNSRRAIPAAEGAPGTEITTFSLYFLHCYVEGDIA